MTKPPIDSAMEKGFAEVVQLIQSAKQMAVQSVNAQLVDLYWQVGAYIAIAMSVRTQVLKYAP